MKNKLFVVIIATVLFILLMAGTACAATDGLNQPYAFEVQSQSDKNMVVQFVGNQMYHQDRYLGFGVSGRPMLSLRYMAEWFGFQVDYDLESSTTLVSNGEYVFRIKPGSKVAEIYWSGEKVKDYELMETPLLKANVLYLYSLDTSALLGLMPYWDNDARTWEVLYRDYSYQELGFPAAVNDDILTIKGLLIDDGQHEMPSLRIIDINNNNRSQTGSVGIIEYSTNSRHKYVIDSTINLQEDTNRLQVSLTLGQRIIFVRDLDVAVNIEAKELVVNPLYQAYQFTSPAKGYLKITEPKLLISGSVAGTDNAYPGEIVLFVRKADSADIMLKESIPIIDGRFKYELELEGEEGLYRVTANTIMAAPRGPAYPEITNFYVEYRQ